jgi:hypothetical protein
MNKGGTRDIFVMKLSSNGDIQWNKTFGGSEFENARSIQQTSDGGYVLTGVTQSNDGDFSGMNKGGFDIYILLLDSSGNIR